MLERIGEVAYRLELPATSLLHPVFHVTALKMVIDEPAGIVEELPTFGEDGEVMLKPKQVLRYRQQWKGKTGERAWQVLIQWQGLLEEETT